MIRKYHTLLSKPLDLFSSNVLVYSSIELLSSASYYMGWPLGIAVTAAGMRVLSIPLSRYLDKVHWVLPRSISPSATKLYQSFFLNDLEKDVKELMLTQSQHESLQTKIAPSVLISQAIQGYLMLGYTRGLHQISHNPQFYEGMQESYLGFFPLCASDPFCFMPLVAGFSTYWILRKAYHPFTLKLSENSCFWIGFGASIAAIPLHSSYILAYSSFSITHLIIKRIKRY